MSNLSSRAKEIRQVIYSYIENRLNTKIEKLQLDDPKYQVEQDKHIPSVWLESAVERSSQIQVVTHPLKATYPHAHIKKTTSLYCRPKDLPQHDWVATQTLGENFTDDVTGNAAALDIYGLLQLQVENKTLLELCLSEDEDIPEEIIEDLCKHNYQQEVKMYVLSNANSVNGASCLLYENVIRNFAEKIKSDLIIIPSSIHEVILLPFYKDMKEEELNDMVKDVNASQVPIDEILSEHIYYYFREVMV